jgi:hypothetical protein
MATKRRAGCWASQSPKEDSEAYAGGGGHLQDALEREVEGGGEAAGAVDPVDNDLPRVVLVVVQLRAIPPAQGFNQGLDWHPHDWHPHD